MSPPTLEALSLSPNHCRLQAWAGSTLFHGLCVGVAMLLITELEPPLRTKPIKLNVAMINPAPPKIQEVASIPKPSPVRKEIVANETTERVSTQQLLHKPEPVQQPLHTQKHEPVIQAHSPLPVKQTRDVRPSEPIQQPPPETVKASHVPEPIQHNVAVQRHASPAPISNPKHTREPVKEKQILTSRPILHEIVSEPINHIFAQSTYSKPIKEENTVTQAKPIMETQHAPAQRETKEGLRPETSDIRREILTKHDIVESTVPVAKKEELFKERPAPRIRQRIAAVERPVQAYPETQDDFGWLAQTIWNQIEKYKRYPSKARQREWEGKVVLEAVIRQDGTILDLRVAESSGHEILDRNALDVLWKLTPLTLNYPLGRPQITILVPLTYQLDG
jgi:periplasmic protein TonB